MIGISTFENSLKACSDSHTSVTINPPSGFTEQFYTASNSLNTSEMSQEIDSSTGATGTIHGTENGGATYSNVTLLIALKAQRVP